MTNEHTTPTLRTFAWALVNVLISTIVLCLVAGIVGAFLWNALTTTTGLPAIGVREGFAFAALLRLVSLTYRI